MVLQKDRNNLTSLTTSNSEMSTNVSSYGNDESINEYKERPEMFCVAKAARSYLAYRN